MTRRTFKNIICLISISALFIILNAPDASAVRVSMKRITFEGKTRSEVLTIINNTGEAQTYRLGWRKYKMGERSSLKAIENDADDDGSILWADEMLRFAPRRVSIPAGSSQQVRILLRRPSGIEEAEYRSHLWILTESKPGEYQLHANNNQQAIRLAIQPAISLPIFVRHGELKATGSISDASMKRTPNGLRVSFTLNRTGNRSLYGDFTFICKDEGEKVLHQLKGISVYTEIEKRYLDFNIPLKGNSCKKVSIEYRSDPQDAQFQGATIAEATVSL